MFVANSAVDFMEETTGTDGKLAGVGKADRSGECFPTGIGEGIRNPLVTVINVVLHNDKVTTGFEVAHQLAQYGFFVTVEV